MPSLEELSKRVAALERYTGLINPEQMEERKPVSKKKQDRDRKNYEIRKRIIFKTKAR